MSLIPAPWTTSHHWNPLDLSVLLISDLPVGFWDHRAPVLGLPSLTHSSCRGFWERGCPQSRQLDWMTSEVYSDVKVQSFCGSLLEDITCTCQGECEMPRGDHGLAALAFVLLHFHKTGVENAVLISPCFFSPFLRPQIESCWKFMKGTKGKGDDKCPIKLVTNSLYSNHWVTEKEVD